MGRQSSWAKTLQLLRAQLLRVVELCATGDCRQSEQQIGQRVAGVGLADEIQKAARLHIAIRGLTDPIPLDARLE